MTEAKHYESSLRRPAAGSEYEFLLTVWSRNIYEGVFPWSQPVDVNAFDQSMLPAVQRYNMVAKQTAEMFDAQVVADVRAAGLAEPLASPAGQKLVAEIASLRRFMLSVWWSQPQARRKSRSQSAKEPGFDKRSCQEIVYGMHLLNPGKSPRELADMLNKGAKTGGGGGIDSDHVRRAIKAYPVRLLRLYGSYGRADAADVAGAHMAAVMGWLRVLQYVMAVARKRPEFRGARGAALVAAIDAQHDFADIAMRAERQLFPHREAG